MKRFLQRYVTLHNLHLWLLLTFVCFMGMFELTNGYTYDTPFFNRWVGITSIAALKATLLTILVAASRRWKPLHYAVKAVIWIYAALSCLNGLLYALFGMGFSITLFAIISQTNLSEALNFWPMLGSALFKLFTSVWLYVSIAGAVALWILPRYLPKALAAFAVLALSLFGIPAFTFYYLNNVRPLDHLLLSRKISVNISVTLEEIRNIKEELARVKPLADAASVKSTRQADVLMVVGESASAQYMSLYGFQLPTTPRLDAMTDSVMVFTDAIGASLQTVFNINRILTFLTDRDDPTRWYDSPLLYSLLHEAGYHTAWISNQEKGGVVSNNVPALLSMADTLNFVGSVSIQDYMHRKYDEAVIPPLAEELAANREAEFVGVHLLGSHSDFRYRYPHDRSRFASADVQALPAFNRLTDWQAASSAYYLNSLVYTDSLLEVMIDLVARRSRPTVMLYFSDHGQAIYSNDCPEVIRDDNHIRVPFVAYANPSFRRELPDLTARLDSARTLPVTTANIAHVICTLTGTSYSAYADSLDFLSPAYRVKPRWVDCEPWRLEHPMP
ncbi:MAG: phosphoethanolamine transferase [Duncaniella sp.]|nr:phosphoethanolamine transferase [Duncaniella sp.]